MDNFWKNKNVLITGIFGFIGSNLAKKLLTEGANIIGIARTSHKESLLHFENLIGKIKIYKSNLDNLSDLIGIIGENRIDNIFHLAAQVEVGIGMSNPYLTFESNTRATYTILEAARLSNIKFGSIIIASTDKSYGDYPSSQMPYKEDYPLKAKFPYDVSKACADMIAQSYSSEIFSMPVVVTRFANIYGPGQLNFSALIPDLIRSALGYSTFEPRGDGMQKRDFLYIDDVINLYSLIAMSLSNDSSRISGEIFNAGHSVPYSVKEIIEKVHNKIRIIDYKDILLKMKSRKTIGEINIQFMSHEKVYKFFGWKPKVSIDDGISKSIIWYKDYLKEKYGKD